MAERVAKPSEAASCNWATVGGAYPSTDPGGAKRGTGWQPKDNPVPGPGEIIAADDQNFVARLSFEMLSWLRDFVPREWADISEGIAAQSVPDTFRVFAPTAGTLARGVLMWSVTGTATGGGIVSRMCTDGEQIYYINGATSERIVAADPADGSEIWEVDPFSATIGSICTDGGFVYAHRGATGSNGLRRFVRSTGAASANAGSEFGCVEMVANGEFVVGIRPNSGNGLAVFYSDIQGAIAEGGTYNTGSALLVDCAIDHEQSYVTGTRNTQDVWANTLSTRALIWSTQLPTSVGAVARCIETDGNAVYVGTERVAVPASSCPDLSLSGFANLFVLDRVNGQPIYSLDINAGTNPDIIRLAIDDEYLYAEEDSGLLTVLKLGGAIPQEVARIADMHRPVADGVSVIGRDFTTVGDFQRNWMYGASKAFMRAASDDVNRRPNHLLAVPTSRI